MTDHNWGDSWPYGGGTSHDPKWMQTCRSCGAIRENPELNPPPANGPIGPIGPYWLGTASCEEERALREAQQREWGLRDAKIRRQAEEERVRDEALFHELIAKLSDLPVSREWSEALLKLIRTSQVIE